MSLASKILNQSRLYHLKKAPLLTEATFEDQIASLLEKVFDDWHVIRFKSDVYSDIYDNTSRPDLALIHKAYKSWCVVEVETSSHDIGRHIIPQVTTFLDGRYNQNHARTILKNYSTIFKVQQLENLICNVQPEVFVISESYNPEWHKILKNEGCKYFAFEPHESERSEWLFYFKGDSPSINKTLLSYCRPSKNYSFLKCLELDNNQALKNIEKNVINIFYNNEPYKWKVFHSESSCFIVPKDNLGVNIEEAIWGLYQDEGFYTIERIK